jgi:hypothetical protein
MKIKYIPGPRNKIANALSRKIFSDKDCGTTPELNALGHLRHMDGQPKWIWKDGKGGYRELLKTIREPLHSQQLEHLMTGRTSPPSGNASADPADAQFISAVYGAMSQHFLAMSLQSSNKYFGSPAHSRYVSSSRSQGVF